MNRRKLKNNKVHVKKDDTVIVLSGNDRNKSGRVLEVNPDKGMAIVEGVNMKTKHQKPNNDNPEGGIVKIEGPIRLSKIQVLVDGEKTRIGRKRDENGKLKRYSKKTGEFI